MRQSRMSGRQPQWRQLSYGLKPYWLIREYEHSKQVLGSRMTACCSGTAQPANMVKIWVRKERKKWSGEGLRHPFECDYTGWKIERTLTACCGVSTILHLPRKDRQNTWKDDNGRLERSQRWWNSISSLIFSICRVLREQCLVEWAMMPAMEWYTFALDSSHLERTESARIVIWDNEMLVVWGFAKRFVPTAYRSAGTPTGKSIIRSSQSPRCIREPATAGRMVMDTLSTPKDGKKQINQRRVADIFHPECSNRSIMCLMAVTERTNNDPPLKQCRMWYSQVAISGSCAMQDQ